MYGNFPSATAVIRRVLPTCSFESPSLAVVVATAAPNLLGEMLPYCPSDSPEKRYLELLEAFLSTGEAGRIEAIREAFIKSLLAAPAPFEGSLLRSARLSLEHLFRLSTARTLHEHCAVLSEEYIRRLVDSGVRVLLPPQFGAVTQHKLLTSAENALVALPTSTGKTLLGELCLVTALQQQSGIVCYLAPYVALGRQVAQSLENHVPQTVGIRRMFGGFRDTEDVASQVLTGTNARMEILVATPERLDALLRTAPALLPTLRCVVCDEAHLVYNDVRGVRLEGLITRLRLLQDSGVPLRLVLLSAVLSQYDKLRQWIGASEASVITGSWKPTARRLAFWREQGTLAWHAGDDSIRRPGTTSHSIIGKLELPWPEYTFYPAKHMGQLRQQAPLVHTNVAYLADMLWKRYGGPMLCLCATKDGTRKVAIALARRFPTIDPLPQGITTVIAGIEKRYRFLLPMANLLKHGVAFHNSTVPHEIRQLIEDALQARELVAVAATTTLAEGVDLPFRCTILVDWLTWQGTEQRPIPSLLFRNVAGRCGRAGVFTEGDTIIFDNPLGDVKYTYPPLRRARLQDDLFLTEEPEELTSALEGAEAAFALAREEPLMAVLASQFMAAIPENPDAEHLAERFAKQTFVAYRRGSDTAIRQQLTAIADNLVDETYGALARAASPLQLTPFGKAANATGFSPQSCRRIAAFLQEKHVVDELTGLADDLLRALGTLPEQTNQDLRKVLSTQRSRFPVKPNDFRQVLDLWLGGAPLEHIFAVLPYVLRSSKQPKIQAWLAGADNASGWDTEFDKFVDFTGAVLGGYLPWLMRACGWLSTYVGGWATQVEWRQWAERLESRTEPA